MNADLTTSPPALTSLRFACTNLLQGGIAVRPFSGTAPQEPPRPSGSGRGRPKGGLVEEKQGNDITDQIPHIVRPMGVVEGTSYTLLIIAGLAFAAAVIWAVVNELLIQPREYTCFNITLKKLQEDPRVTVRLGTPVSGYGQESRNRQARQRIPHRVFKDANGVEKIQVQFFAKGPSGNARVSAEMYLDDSKQWQYAFLYMDLEYPVPTRVTLIEPRYY